MFYNIFFLCYGANVFFLYFIFLGISRFTLIKIGNLWNDWGSDDLSYSFYSLYDKKNITQPYPYVKQNTYKHIKWGNI